MSNKIKIKILCYKVTALITKYHCCITKKLIRVQIINIYKKHFLNSIIVYTKFSNLQKNKNSSTLL